MNFVLMDRHGQKWMNRDEYGQLPIDIDENCYNRKCMNIDEIWLNIDEYS